MYVCVLVSACGGSKVEEGGRDLDKIQWSSGKETTTSSFPAPLPRQRPAAEGLCLTVMPAGPALSSDLAVPARGPARGVVVSKGGGEHSCPPFDVAGVRPTGSELSEFALTPQMALAEEDLCP